MTLVRSQGFRGSFPPEITKEYQLMSSYLIHILPTKSTQRLFTLTPLLISLEDRHCPVWWKAVQLCEPDCGALDVVPFLWHWQPPVGTGKNLFCAYIR